MKCYRFVFQKLFKELSNESILDLIETYCLNNDIEESHHHFLITKGPLKIENLIKSLRVEYLYFLNTKAVSFKKKINNDEIIIHFDALAKTKNGALRGFVFTNLSNEHDIHWSIVHNLEWQTLKDIYYKEGFVKGQQAKLFVIGFANNNFFTKSIDRYYMKYSLEEEIELTIKDYKKSISKPKFPCPDRNCIYKGICKP